MAVTTVMCLPLLLLLLLLLLLIGCHGDEPRDFSQLIVLRDLPPGGDTDGPHHFILRSNFEGSVEFVESDEFRIEINVTAPSAGDLAKLQYNYTHSDGSILLQMYEADPRVAPSPVSFILLAIGGATVLGFGVSMAAVCWWKEAKKEELEAAAHRDPTHAPLLEPLQPAADVTSPDVVVKVKKRRKPPPAPARTPSPPCYPDEPSAPLPPPLSTPACLYGVAPSPVTPRPTPPAPAPPTRGACARQTQRAVVQKAPPGGSSENMPDIVRGRDGASPRPVAVDDRTIPVVVAAKADIWMPDNGTAADVWVNGDGGGDDDTPGRRPSETARVVPDDDGVALTGPEVAIRALGSGSLGSGSSGSVVTVVAAGDGQGRHEGQARRVGTAADKAEKKGGPRLGHMTYLHVAVVVCVAALGVTAATGGAPAGGVTRVAVRLSAPSSFLARRPELYLSVWRPVNVSVAGFRLPSLDVQWFEVDDRKVVEPQGQPCVGNTCTQGCDVYTGLCVCRHGYYLKNGYICEDINECLSPACTCHRRYAQCVNTLGSFECKCIEGYYGDGKTCIKKYAVKTTLVGCSEPCPRGMFKVMSCTDSENKLCAKCRTSCMAGYYIGAGCAAEQDIECRVCRKKCERDEYEYARCHAKQNRQCKKIEELPKPGLRKTMIYEDRTRAEEKPSHVVHEDQTKKAKLDVILDRGGGFSVEVKLLKSNLAPLYEPVNHLDGNDNDQFYGDTAIFEHFCPYPIPEKYKLRVTVHKGVTTAAHPAPCGTAELACPRPGGAGYILDPTVACKTYELFGKLPRLATEGASVLCSGAGGRLAAAFELGDVLDDVTTTFVDKTIDCAEQRKRCDACGKTCAERMQRHRVSNRCNVTGDDADNGLSPRLAYCHACCSRKDCAKVCEVYSNAACQRLRCATGNVAQFALVPQFSTTSTMFACHVRRVPAYDVYDINFRVLRDGRPITDRWLHATKRVDGAAHPALASDRHHFLQVSYGSKVTIDPDLIQGDASSRIFTAGHYQASGPSIDAARIRAKTALVRSRRPFAANSKVWAQQGCDGSLLSSLISATGSAPYRPNAQLSVSEADKRYRLFNTTHKCLPFLYVKALRDESVLRPMFPATRLNDDSLGASLTHQGEQWVLTVNATLEDCPGAVEVRVVDPAYPSQALYHYDIGVTCPRDLSVTFTVPTADGAEFDKRLDVTLTDSHRAVTLRVMRPASRPTPKTTGSPLNYEDRGEKMTVITPFLIAMTVVIVLFLVLILVGFITEEGEAWPEVEGEEGGVHSYHLVFVVGLVTFRAAYSIAVTFTVLLLLVLYVNRDSTAILAGFSRYSSSAENTKQTTIDQIHAEAMREIERQNALANQTKAACNLKLDQLNLRLEEAKQKIVVKAHDTELISQMALRYTKLMVENLTKNVEHFKTEFSAYARDTLEQLTRSIAQTTTSLESSAWLAGPRLLHDTVEERRKARGAATKPFLQWLGLDQRVRRLTADLSVDDFPLPEIALSSGASLPPLQPPAPPPRASPTLLPRNVWRVDREPAAPRPPPARRFADRPPGGATSRQWLFVAALVALDIVWFVHRMVCTYATARALLYGSAAVVSGQTEEDGEGGDQPSASESSSSSFSRCVGCLKRLNLRIMKTEFVPKLVAGVTSCCCVYLVIVISSSLLTVKTLADVGYFESFVYPTESSYDMAMARVDANSRRINGFEFALIDQLTNLRVKRSQLVLDLYASLQKHDPYAAEQCAWRHLLGEKCSGDGDRSSPGTWTLPFDGCDFTPVSARPLQRPDFAGWRRSLARSAVPYVNATRQIVTDSSYLLLLFIAALAVVDSFSAALWIYLKKFHMLRLRPMFAIPQRPLVTDVQAGSL